MPELGSKQPIAAVVLALSFSQGGLRQQLQLVAVLRWSGPLRAVGILMKWKCCWLASVLVHLNDVLHLMKFIVRNVYFI